MILVVNFQINIFNRTRDRHIKIKAFLCWSPTPRFLTTVISMCHVFPTSFAAAAAAGAKRPTSACSPLLAIDGAVVGHTYISRNACGRVGGGCAR